jgi:phospholipid N-methyltransferase
MTLSNLVKNKQGLLTFSTTAIRDLIKQYEDELALIHNLPYCDTNPAINSITALSDNISDIEKNIADMIAVIDGHINELTKDFHTRGYKIGDNFGSNSTDVATERNYRNLIVPSQIISKVIGKIRLHTNSLYPALEIGPGDGIWTSHLVAADPLYLVDVHQEFLDKTISLFPEAYQRRLRPYKLDVSPPGDTDLSQLPQNQFGFVFAWNVFDFFPLTHVQAYLTSCFNIMRSGGIMLFSYNNCDHYQCAKYAESGYKSWMPKTLLEKTIIKHGFEVMEFESESNTYWVTIKKPGLLATVKAHQVLGKIIKEIT